MRTVTAAFEPEEDDFDERRTAEEMLLEVDGLNAAAQVIEFGADRRRAERLVRDALARRKPVAFPEHTLIDFAMMRIVGAAITTEIGDIADDSNQWSTHLARATARAWIAWIKGHSDAATEILDGLQRDQLGSRYIKSQRGGVNTMTMEMWRSAVEALVHQDTRLAKKLWKRAMEVGSSFGTKGNLLVQWSYTASFYPVL